MKGRNYKQAVLNRRKDKECKCEIHVSAGGYRVTTKYCWKHKPVYEPMTAEKLGERLSFISASMRDNKADVLSANDMEIDIIKESSKGETKIEKRFFGWLDDVMDKFENK